MRSRELCSGAENYGGYAPAKRCEDAKGAGAAKVAGTGAPLARPAIRAAGRLSGLARIPDSNLTSRTVRKCQEPSFQQVGAAGFDALKMYRLVLKKYLPVSLRRSNSLCHSFRSSTETSLLRATKSRILPASPLL